MLKLTKSSSSWSGVGGFVDGFRGTLVGPGTGTGGGFGGDVGAGVDFVGAAVIGIDFVGEVVGPDVGCPNISTTTSANAGV